MLRWGRVSFFAAMTMLGVQPSHAEGETAERCSRTYHGALTQLQSSRADGLGGIFKQMRTSDAALPGRWLFGSPPQNTRNKKIDLTRARVERVCVEERRVGGRLRCQQFDERVVPSSEIGFRVAPTADEARVLKGLTDFVEGRGAIAEVGNNGRYSWLVQRMAQDLKIYISQPAHPALCSGGAELSEFYDVQLGPLHKRVQDIDGLVVRARDLALMRSREALGLRDVVRAQAAQSSEAALRVEELGAISRRASEGLSASTPVDALMKAVARTLLTEAEFSDLQSEGSVLAMVRRMRSNVIGLQDRVAAGEVPEGMSVESIDAAKRAFRMIEAAEVATLQRRAYQPFIDLVLSTPQSILNAHKASCTCDE